ncbi:hypothetical protein EKN06_00540 [Croceicoccus ponticola]|uniref:Uncharacterized protein n=1 Tax=Croceicoccus ponticola TaxID=2217664 RepID=A0A437GZG7_9SPHN|nr:hypothetical protein [Croceicoccus ponticola]RVQ68757.1 hypothetical protein EKN06_00540 [Croceicoccus ponticola]
MIEYNIDPATGIMRAFFTMNPDATHADLEVWIDGLERSEADPRLLCAAYANICQQALTKLEVMASPASCFSQIAEIAGALSHFETSMRAYSAVIGHRRFEKLAQMQPLEALKVCLQNRVMLDELV